MSVISVSVIVLLESFLSALYVLDIIQVESVIYGGSIFLRLAICATLKEEIWWISTNVWSIIAWNVDHIGGTITFSSFEVENIFP